MVIGESVETVDCFYEMLCAKAKTRRLYSGCSGVLRTPTPQVCRTGGFEPMNRSVNCISTAFAERTKLARVRRLEGTSGSCTTIVSQHAFTEFWTKLDRKVLLINQGHKRFKNWPRLGEELSEVCLVIKCPFKLIPYF